MNIIQIDAKMAKDFLITRHYSGRSPSVSVAFAEVDNGRTVAVCTFGKPASPYLCFGICGKEHSARVYELNRLCRVDEYKGQISAFVSECLRRIRGKDWIIVSYADMAMNHNGYIYQATNFLYTGATKKRTDIFAGDGKHSRHYGEDDLKSDTRIVRSSKHRYVYFCTKHKALKKAWVDALRYPILPYPKGENKTYKLGDFISSELIKIEKDKLEAT